MGEYAIYDFPCFSLIVYRFKHIIKRFFPHFAVFSLFFRNLRPEKVY